MDAKNQPLKISNAVTLDANNPIPYQFGSNAFAAFDGSGYLPFLGSDDNFFKTLLEARLLSVTANACVTTKRDYMIGEGWYITNLADKEKIDQDFLEWAESVNNKNETLNKVSTQNFGNFLSSGNVFIELVRGKAGGKGFVKVYVHSCLECRLGKPGDDDIVRTVIKSKRFKENGIYFGGKEGAIEIPIYDPLRPKQSWKKDGPVERSMIFIKNEVEGVEYYGMPSNISGLPQQVLEYEMVRYNLDDLENNMNPGGVMILQGNVTQAEANKMGKAIIKQHVGKGKRGRWVVIASENGIDNSKLEQFQTKKEGSFIESDKRNESKIIFANGWDALLAGLSDAGSLGKGNAFILNLFRMKYQTVIKPVQSLMIEEFLNVVIKIHDEYVGTKWSRYDLAYLTNTPINILDNDTTIDTWTVDEVRAEAGLVALGGDRGKMLVGELKKSNQNVQSQPVKA